MCDCDDDANDNDKTTNSYIFELKKEIEALKIRAEKFEAFDILRLKLATDKLKGAGMSTAKGSGVTVEIKNLNGVGITGKFGIIDGLSPETIAALTADLERTFLERVQVNTPYNLRKNVELLFYKNN